MTDLILPHQHGEAVSRVYVEDNRVVHEIKQDVEPHLEYVKNLRSMNMTGDKEMRHAGHLPDVVIETYCNVNGITYAEAINNPVHIKAMLNDQALSNLRVWKGRV